MIPIRILAALIDRTFNRFDSETQAIHHATHSTLVAGAAYRLGAQFKAYGPRNILTRDAIRVELKFGTSHGAIRRAMFTVIGRPPGFPTFRMTKRGVFARKPRGILPLESQFAIQTDDPEALRQLWSDELCQHFSVIFSNATIRSRGPTIELVCPTYGDQGTLDSAFQLLFSLAGKDVYATEALRGLGTYHEEELPYVIVPGTDARIGYARVEERVVTEARDRDGNVIQTWPNVVREPKRLEEIASKLLAEGAPREGVFR